MHAETCKYCRRDLDNIARMRVKQILSIAESPFSLRNASRFVGKERRKREYVMRLEEMQRSLQEDLARERDRVEQVIYAFRVQGV